GVLRRAGNRRVVEVVRVPDVDLTVEADRVPNVLGGVAGLARELPEERRIEEPWGLGRFVSGSRSADDPESDEPHEYAGATVKPILHFSSFLLERGVRASPDPPSECPLSAGENHAPSVSPAQARWALFACRPPPLHRSTTGGRRS